MHMVLRGVLRESYVPPNDRGDTRGARINRDATRRFRRDGHIFNGDVFDDHALGYRVGSARL